MQGGDKLCCSSASYRSTLNRICRKCDVKGAQAGDAFAKCNRIAMSKIEALVRNKNKEKLDEYNQYMVNNAWFKVSFGGCKFGIFTAACPVEPLHALKQGLISDCIKVLFDEVLKKTDKAQVDVVTRQLTKLPRQRFLSACSGNKYPRNLWNDGVTDLKFLSADQKVGILFTIVLLSVTTLGQKVFVDAMGGEKTRDMIEVFQMMLCYLWWLKRTTFWKRGDKTARDEAQQAIRILLMQLTDLWPRNNGQGWVLAKFHEQLHVTDDIERNGNPHNSDSGPTERHHIDRIKKPATRTQRRKGVLDWQIACRQSESMMLDLVYLGMQLPTEDNKSQERTCDKKIDTGVASVKRHLNPDDWEIPPSVKRNKNNHCEISKQATRAGFKLVPGDEPTIICLNQNPFPRRFMNRFSNCMDRHFKDLDVSGIAGSTKFVWFTELKKHGEVIFRAHPHYSKSSAAWHDWVMVRWLDRSQKRLKGDVNKVNYGDNTNLTRKYSYSPCEIQGFFVTERQPDMLMAVVCACNYTYKQNNVFMTEWTMNKRNGELLLYVIDMNSVVRHCLVIPADANNRYGGKLFDVWDPERWGELFHKVK